MDSDGLSLDWTDDESAWWYEIITDPSVSTQIGYCLGLMAHRSREGRR